MANPNPTRWNLTVGQRRPDSPLGPTGGMTYHHTIPYNILRDFWNRSVAYNLDEFRGLFLRPFAQAVGRYPVCPGDPDAATGLIADVTRVLNEIVSGAVTHDAAGPEPPNWRWVRGVYAWMPGNLFLGPTLRPKDRGWGSDPEENFDTFASQCMDAGRYLVVLQARRAIEAYLAIGVQPIPAAGRGAGPDVLRARAARAAAAALARVAEYPAPTSFNEEDWAGTGTRF
jgi:hypothetical protein